MPEFMLLIKGGDYSGMSAEENQKVVEHYIAWARKLRAENRMKGGDELQPNGRVLSVQNGAIVDGPFIEAKESIGGYFLIEADSYNHAVEISKECPSLRYNGVVEIRQISDYK